MEKLHSAAGDETFLSVCERGVDAQLLVADLSSISDGVRREDRYFSYRLGNREIAGILDIDVECHCRKLKGF
jgi:hypothetical protein